MLISSVFNIPQDLDTDVDIRAIDEAKQLFRNMSYLDQLRYLLDYMFCFNKAVYEKDQSKVVQYFIYVEALRELLQTNLDALRFVNHMDQYTKQYLLSLIWGFALREALPPEIQEYIQTEVLPTVQLVPVTQVQQDPRLVAMLIGAFLILVNGVNK